jgi:hypothetical protein
MEVQVRKEQKGESQCPAVAGLAAALAAWLLLLRVVAVLSMEGVCRLLPGVRISPNTQACSHSVHTHLVGTSCEIWNHSCPVHRSEAITSCLKRPCVGQQTCVLWAGRQGESVKESQHHHNAGYLDDLHQLLS